MISIEEVKETRNNLIVHPYNGHLLVLLPAISDTTDSGIIKGESNMEDDKTKMDAFMTVIGVAKDIEEIKVYDRVYSQGTVVVFDPDLLPEELDVAPDGYTIGLLPVPYVKMICPYQGKE